MIAAVLIVATAACATVRIARIAAALIHCFNRITFFLCRCFGFF